MPEFSITHDLAAPPAAVFAFLTTTANLPRLVPPDVALELVEAPAVLRLGDRLTWKGSRWGISQRVTLRVSEWEEPGRLVLVQERGPFARWVQTQTFEPHDGGTRLAEAVAFEPPGGLLGRFLGADKVLDDLRSMYAHRGERLRELISP